MKKDKTELERLKLKNARGYVYDLYFLFMLHYNREQGFADAVNYKKSVSDTEFYSKILARCNVFPQSLIPFFWHNSSRCFMLTCCFTPDLIAERDTVDTLCEGLSAEDFLFRKMIEYYFPRADISTLTKDSVAEIAALIRNSEYDDRIKSGLYSFFLDVSATVELLCSQLREKAQTLDRIRCDYGFNADDLMEEFDVDEFLLRYERVKEVSLIPEKLDVSFCCAAKNTVELLTDGDDIMLMLGTDWLYAIEAMALKKRPELDSFGNVISEKNRIEILELMLRNGTATIKDIEQELGLTGTNAYYHLNLMIRTGMVWTRTVGRTVFYSVDKDYFTAVIGMLKNFAQ